MNTAVRPLALALVLACSAPLAHAQVGKLFFQKGEVTIVGVDGRSRAAQPGDLIQPGERIITGPDAMAQIRSSDGSLLGLRPDSNIRLDGFTGVEGGKVLLDAGSVRVLNLPDAAGGARPMPIQLEAAGGRVTLQGADAETAVRKVGANVTAPEAGLLTRVNAGSATARTSAGDVALPVHGVNLASAAALSPAAVESLPPVRINPGPAATVAGVASVPQPAPARFGAPDAVNVAPSVATLNNTFPTVRVGSTATFTPTVGTTPLTTTSRTPVTAGTAVDLLVNASLQPKSTTTTLNVSGVSGTVAPTAFTTTPGVTGTQPTATGVAGGRATTVFTPVASGSTTTILTPTTALVPTTGTSVLVPRTTTTGNLLQFRR